MTIAKKETKMSKRKQKRASKFKRIVNLALVGVMIFQLAVVLRPVETKASDIPSGEVKRYIVWYRGASITPNTGVSVKTHEQLLLQQAGWLKGQFENSTGYKKVIEQFSQMPYVIIEADKDGLKSVENNANVVAVAEDKIIKPMAESFVTTPDDLGGTGADGFSNGSVSFTGDGQAVVVIDSGVDTSHEAFDENTLISEACYSVNTDAYSDVTVTSTCPGAVASSTATGSAVPTCTTPLELEDYGTEDEFNAANETYGHCTHGTAVAGLMVMKRLSGEINSENIDVSGIAKNAKLVAIKNDVQVTEKPGSNQCGNADVAEEVCYGFLASTMLASLQRVLELANDDSFTTPIAAVNISQGGGEFFSTESECNTDASQNIMLGAISSLALHGITTVVAAGNSGEDPQYVDKVSAPACLSNAVAVGAIERGGGMTSYSNAGAPLDIVTLGGSQADGGIFSPAVNNDQWTLQAGTSMAAPIIAGAYGVMRENNPSISAESILTLFKDTGESIVEDRDGYAAATYKSLDLSAALSASGGVPVIESFMAAGSPSSLEAGESVELNVVASIGGGCSILTNGEAPGVAVDFDGLNLDGDSLGSATVEVPATGDEVTYTLVCVDDENDEYFSQQQLSFALSGGTPVDPPVTPPTTGGDQDPVALAGATGEPKWTPGTPDAGVTTQQRIQASIIASLCFAVLFMFNRSTLNRIFR